MRLPRRVFPLAILCLAAACERPSAAPPVDSAVVVRPDSVVVAPTTVVETGGGWDASAGSVLFVARPDRVGSAAVVFPELSDSAMEAATTFDTARVHAARVDLFAPAGTVGVATVAGMTATTENECSAWPSARLVGAVTPWTVGFTAGAATPIRLDSAAAFAPTDSARLAAEVARLAAALPNDTSAGLRGVPFAVREMRRFSPARGVEAVVATVTRKLNVEASPLAEEIVLVAERDSAGPANAFTTAYFSRSSATEELVQTTDVLAAVHLGSARTPTLVVSRLMDDGSFYSVLQRVGPRQWRLRWTSAYTGC
jgi:hypothetical protein